MFLERGDEREHETHRHRPVAAVAPPRPQAQRDHGGLVVEVIQSGEPKCGLKQVEGYQHGGLAVGDLLPAQQEERPRRKREGEALQK